jgi:hypothetical protein
MPISFLPGKEILPRRYILHKHTKVCVHCNREHSYTNIYAWNEMLSRTGAGAMIRHLVPIERIDYNLPIEVVSLPFVTVPACHECVGTLDLAHLPDPRPTPEWQRQYAPSWAAAERAASTAKSRTKAPPKTIDDLLQF